MLYIYEIDAISANPHNLSITHTKRKLGVDPQSENTIVKNNTKSTVLMKPWYDRTHLGYLEWFCEKTQLLEI